LNKEYGKPKPKGANLDGRRQSATRSFDARKQLIKKLKEIGIKICERNIAEIERMWGFKERTTTTYLEVSRLSNSFKKKFLQHQDAEKKLDAITAAGISTTKEWDNDLKEEAAEEGDNIKAEYTFSKGPLDFLYSSKIS